MQEKLVIMLHAQDLAHPSYVVLDQQANASKIVLQCDGSELAQAAQQRTVVVIVPSEDVLIASIILPKMNRVRLMQAIPFALEEQLIEDVDTMHFAAGEYQPNQPLSVCITARSKMTEWNALLQQWQITTGEMIPAIFALPEADNEWFILANNTVNVRLNHDNGFACDKDNLCEMLNMALASAAIAPQLLRIENTNDEALNLSLPIKSEETKITAEQALELMAKAQNNPAPVNLLQGYYQTKKSRGMPQLNNMLKISVYLCAVWLALMFIYPIVSTVILQSRANAISEQIAVIYKRNFPNAGSNVGLAKDRMQQKLTKLTSGVSDNRLLTMLANIGKGLSKAVGVQLKRMDYQNNTMTLEISANSSAAFANFTDALAQQGLRVKQQNANLNGARVNASLQIE